MSLIQGSRWIHTQQAQQLCECIHKLALHLMLGLKYRV